MRRSLIKIIKWIVSVNVVNLVNVEMSIGKYVVKGLGWGFVQESSNFHCQSLQYLLTV